MWSDAVHGRGHIIKKCIIKSPITMTSIKEEAGRDREEGGGGASKQKEEIYLSFFYLLSFPHYLHLIYLFNLSESQREKK